MINDHQKTQLINRMHFEAFKHEVELNSYNVLTMLDMWGLLSLDDYANLPDFPQEYFE